jgi:hypothetical protein
VLQGQVEMNWNSPKVFWNRVMKDGGFEYDGQFIEWNKTLEVLLNMIRKHMDLRSKIKRKKNVLFIQKIGYLNVMINNLIMEGSLIIVVFGERLRKKMDV